MHTLTLLDEARFLARQKMRFIFEYQGANKDKAGSQLLYDARFHIFKHDLNS